MPHYVCLGSCNGITKQPGACAADRCEMRGRPLVACECKDNNHADLRDITRLEDEIEKTAGE